MVGSRNEKIVDGAQHGFTREIIIAFVVFTERIIYLEIKRYKFL